MMTCGLQTTLTPNSRIDELMPGLEPRHPAQSGMMTCRSTTGSMFRRIWKDLFQRAPEVRLDRRFIERPEVGLLKPTFRTRKRTTEKALKSLE